MCFQSFSWNEFFNKNDNDWILKLINLNKILYFIFGVQNKDNQSSNSLLWSLSFKKMSRNNMTDEIISFQGLLENRSSKIFSMTLSVFLCIFVPATIFGVIWYERFGSDLQRIFINKMVSSVCWSILGFYGFTQLPELVFYLSQGFLSIFVFST